MSLRLRNRSLGVRDIIKSEDKPCLLCLMYKKSLIKDKIYENTVITKFDIMNKIISCHVQNNRMYSKNYSTVGYKKQEFFWSIQK